MACVQNIQNDCRMLTAVLNTTAFERLKWSIFKLLSQIQIANEVDAEEPTYRPFTLEDPVAKECATTPPLHKLHLSPLCLGAFEEHCQWSNPVPEEEFKNGIFRPAVGWDEVQVTREDGGALTVGDVVVQLHAFFQRMKGHISEVVSQMYNVEMGNDFDEPLPEGLDLWFTGVRGDEITEEHSVGVTLGFERENGEIEDEYW